MTTASRKATLKRYYETHKEERKAQNKEWYSKKVGSGYNTGKRRKRVSADFNNDDWEWCLRIFDHRCLRCGSRDNLERDHVIPIDEGGKKGLDNLQPLCRACNAMKRTSLQDSRKGTIARLFGLGYHGRGMM